MIPHLAILRNELTPTGEERPTLNAELPLLLDLLPYALGAASLAVSELIYAEYLVANAILGAAARDQTIHLLIPDQRDLMALRVDAFLESARRAQNAVVPYISRALHMSLPQSLDDVLKKATGRGKLPDWLRNTLVEYWESSGQRLKDYRDLSQHHALVSSDAHVFWRRPKEPAIFLVLPNNPHVKSAVALTFEPPLVHAAPYCCTAFVELLQMVYRVTRPLLADPPPKTRIHRVRVHPGIRLGGDTPLEGCPLYTTDGFWTEIAQAIRTLQEQRRSNESGA